MLSVKKTMAVVLAMSSSVVFSGAMGPVCSSVNVTIPCENTAWEVGGQALYLQPTSTLSSFNFSGTSGTNGSLNNLPDPWAWGFQLEAGYHYGTGSDTNLNWYHVNNSASKTPNLAGNAVALTNYTSATIPTNSTAVFSINPKWDEVNLEFGQHVDFGDTKSVRFHGGIEYARLDNTGSVTVNIPTNAVSVYASNSASYNGFGPRVGLDLNYNWGNGLGIYANGATSLLAGSVKFSSYGNLISSGITSSYSLSGSSTSIVPELESKLGIQYDYPLAQGDLNFDFGWLWINYFNSHSNVSSYSSEQVVAGDFGLQGLYFGVKWLANVA